MSLPIVGVIVLAFVLLAGLALQSLVGFEVFKALRLRNVQRSRKRNPPSS